MGQLEQLQKQVDAAFTVPIPDWKFSRPDTAGGEKPDLDDSQWQTVAPGYAWQGENTNVWFRTKIQLPDQVRGEPVAGHAVRLQVGMDDDGEIYLNGVLKEAFHWDDGFYTLTPKAAGNETYSIALRGINGPGDGQLRSANLVFDVLPELGRYITEARFVQQLQGAENPSEQGLLASVLDESLGQIAQQDCDVAAIDRLRGELSSATSQLETLASITKKADVYYVGHAHIDMNWLWTWPETIDVCHRTWNSAMNLMDEFPDFHFVQSQPGAYVPIQAQFPEEFRRMQEHRERGQWDTVGGLWDESDTDIPSGEGLARSLFLGQRFYKQNFGAYATTAWLPDSFGHSWQLPQLYHLAGMDAYYHMRPDTGLPLTWWEGEDGTRILTANAQPYNADVDRGQLVEPWNERKRSGLPENLVVFGVGDHGGGPTREQILKIEQFKDDPILPAVHMTGIGSYFEGLKSRSGAASIPVVDHDLQYVSMGCYTTHADLKKALRDSENALYSAEALNSLAAMAGSSYPADTLEANWKPTAFAQFHDIACGSAIHSTYDWMLEQLRPTIQSSRDEQKKALDALTAQIDTTGPGVPIAVWNPLSFARDDVVQVALPNAGSYRSVVDQAGNRLPAQADSSGNLVFVAKQVPGFGHKVYFPSTEARPSSLAFTQDADAVTVQTATLGVRIDKLTGAISKLVYKPDDWNVFGDAKDGNTFQVLGDRANAWDIDYTGENRPLNDPSAGVSVVESGPVFLRLRVTRHFGASSYRQDLTIYADLDRVDVPTDIDWHEHGKLVKLEFPVSAGHGAASAQIPYGHIRRPTHGQECPGQKWMDYSDETPQPVTEATPLDLLERLNSDSRNNFDTDGYGYPPYALPKPERITLGAEQIPFDMRTGIKGGHDNVSCQGQTISVPPGARGDTLFLLGASAPTGTEAGVTFQYEGGPSQTQAARLNDWCLTSYDDNEAAIEFQYRYQAPDKQADGHPHLWIARVRVPPGQLKAIRLPFEPRMHIFAATLANDAPAKTIHGLSVLNDGKYGFDVANGVFRLTVLRSSGDPDPNPDEGRQLFTYSLYPHKGSPLDSGSEQQGLALNCPLAAVVTGAHKAGTLPPAISIASDHVIAGALKHFADGNGYVLRVYETRGLSGPVMIDFGRSVVVEETDLLERPLHRHDLTVSGSKVNFQIGHDQIVTLHFTY